MRRLLVVAAFLALHAEGLGCSSRDGAGDAAGSAAGRAGSLGLAGGGLSAGGSSTAGALPGAGRPAGGASARGGSGGASAGRAGAGGRAATAGAGGSAGAPAGGRAGGGAGTGSDGAAAGAPGASGCKRGIAANVAPGPAFSSGLAWWYDWSMQGGGSVEFVPMAWGKDSVTASLPADAKYWLTFNEPNFHAQSNLTAEEAAALWPMLETKAKAAGVPLVSPGMNFCGPAADCNGTDPYQYLKDFFQACKDCEVDYVAVHWYNCDLPSLRDYLEPGGNLEGFEQFGKPIWLTEFSCDGGASVAEQEAYMRAAIPYLEQNPHVFRYAWFSADPIPNARLIEADGSPTALGDVYLGLEQSCP